MENKYDDEIRRILKEIRELETNIDRAHRYSNDASHLIQTVERKTKLIELLLKG